MRVVSGVDAFFALKRANDNSVYFGYQGGAYLKNNNKLLSLFKLELSNLNYSEEEIDYFTKNIYSKI